VKRLLPLAAAPVAVAGVAAAFAFGNSPAGPADVAVKQATPTTTAETAHASSSQLLALTTQSRTGLPVMTLDAGKVAAIKTTGKHHRVLPAKYTVKSGDTLASIAQHLYGSANYWTALYNANHTTIKYANEISVGQALTVPAKPAKAPAAPKELAPVAAPVAAASTVSASTSSSSSSSSSSSTTQVASTSVSTSGDGSFQACVIAAESGGNSQVMNASGHYGLYQFSESTWVEYGGSASDFGDASVAEQNQVFDNAIAAGGESNWSAYDGC
jgi:LysM repeat protein